MIGLIIRLFITITVAFLAGKLIAKLKLPSILGWLITGMALGPHGLAILNENLLNENWYHAISQILECALGLMIGTELVGSKLKKSGKSIFITTLTQSLGTFAVVSLVFAIVFYICNIPIYLAFIFGGIALATAPAPALSIVKEFNTSGPVTRTLIPMAALDDIVGCIVFFSVMGIVAGTLSAGHLPVSKLILVILLPLVIGVITGYIAGLLLKKERNPKETFALTLFTILMTSGVGFYFNYKVLSVPILNFMLIGMAFSATFSNMVSSVRLNQIMKSVRPVLGISIIVVILNLGAPLDFHLILGAGLFTAIYIIARAIGKYFGAYFGASITNSPKTVKKYLGLTLLPHSGVSLIFTGIAVSVLKKSGSASEPAQILQGTIAAAAVINEVIAVILAKKGFELAGEFKEEAKQEFPVIITISRQYGSGGRDIGRKLAEKLNIPFYDHNIIELAVKNSGVEKDFFENIEDTNMENILADLSSGAQSGISTNDLVFLHQSKVIQDIAEEGSCVIVGRCADYVLKNRPNVFKVFVSSDFEKRKNRIENVYHEPTEEIKRIDKNRASYYHHYTGQDYGNANNFDLSLNSGSLGLDTCVEIIISSVKNI